MEKLKAFEVFVDISAAHDLIGNEEIWIVIAGDLDEAIETLHLEVEEQGPPYTEIIEAEKFDIREMSLREIRDCGRPIFNLGGVFTLVDYLAQCKDAELII